MDLRGPIEQFVGPAQQRGGDSAFEMRLAGRVTAEAVKDSKRPLTDPEGVPRARSSLLGDETLGACKKCGDLLLLLLLPGFAFKLTDRATFFTDVLHESPFLSATGRGRSPLAAVTAGGISDCLLPAQQELSPETAYGRDHKDRERVPGRDE